MAHFIPTAFDQGVTLLLHQSTKDVARPVVCSQPLVQASVIESPHGVAIPLVNWSAGPVTQLQVTVNIDVPAKARLASGGEVTIQRDGQKTVATLSLDVADALIFE